MKTQTIMSKTKFVLLAFLVAFSFSCSPEDGNDGAPGAEGPQGPTGTDGNANVIVKTVIPDPGPNLTWTAGTYLGVDANVHAITDTDITQDVSDNSMIVVYFQLFGEDIWYPMTYSIFYPFGGGEIITFTYSLNNLKIYAFNDSGVINSQITKVKYFIIDSSSSSRMSINYPKMSYEEITNHFGLEL